jgi:hypothetical protein
MKLILAALLPLSLFAKYPAPAPQDESNFGSGIQRSMTLLATSTPQKRNTVKVLFYGQSITKQDWWQLVAADLRTRFPNADLIIANRAIGGFAAGLLRRPIEHDLIPFYPDLVIFHDYGGDEDYEWIIREIRSRTTAEIAIQTDHLTWWPGEIEDPKQMKAKLWHDKHCFEWLPMIAAKYKCELMEIRNPWEQYLRDNHLEPRDLLTDGVHLNDRGNFLLSELVKRHLRHDQKFPDAAWKNLTHTYEAKWENGRIALEFEGNRVDLITSRDDQTPYTWARILIDGKKPSEFPELYAFARPSDTVGADWPFIKHLAWQKPLVVEDWYLKVLEADETAKTIRFEVRGSVTGLDGSGVSTERFVSNSGRIVIEPRDWHAADARAYSKKPMPNGYEVHWRVVPMFADIYVPVKADDSAKENFVTVAQGLKNGKHKLELIQEGVTTPQLGWIRVYTPPFEAQ